MLVGLLTVWLSIEGWERVTYLVGDLELLALADIGGLGDGSLEPRQSLVVQVL